MTKAGDAISLLLVALSGCAQGTVPTQKPELLLITALPIVTGEKFALDATGSPALTRLEQDFRVRPIGISDAGALRGGTLLLMAQPRAQPAEALVDLDAWVRGGGRVMILADPRLDWPSGRPLGDVLRPPFEYADTGLLKHWGLTLDPPGVAGPTKRKLGSAVVTAANPGTLHADTGSVCQISSDGFIADCPIGKGRAEVIADADFLNVEQPAGLDSFVGEIQRLARDR